MSKTDRVIPNLESAVAGTTNVHNCCDCSKADGAETMVACDQCSRWWHFACAGVDADIADKSWKCTDCCKTQILDPEHMGSKRSAKSVISVRSTASVSQLRLHHLEEQKEMEDRYRKEQAERDLQFLVQKHNLEMAIMQEGRNPGSERRSAILATNMRVEAWVNDARNTEKEVSATTVIPLTSSTPLAPPNQHRHNHGHQEPGRAAANDFMLPPSVPTGPREQVNVENGPPKPDHFRRDPAPSYINQPSTSCAMQMHQVNFGHRVFPTGPPAASKCQPEIQGLPRNDFFHASSRNHPPPISQQFVNGLPQVNQQVPSNGQPTQNIPQYPPEYVTHQPFPNYGPVLSAQQFAARQVVSKDLPKFAGDPLEWPMFEHAFESTTAMCGIQPDENLARLQRSLIGNAREKVLSILTVPSAVPEIMATLRAECGRPDQLINSLISRIRNTSPPSINKFDSLVTFGREVRNLITYIEAANLQSHLNNPSLVTELAAKLPSDLLLQWGMHIQLTQQATLKEFCNFVSAIRAAACNVSVPSKQSVDGSIKKDKRKDKGTFVNVHQEADRVYEKAFTKSSTNNTAAKPCLGCSSRAHKIRDCQKFRSLTVMERLKLVEEKGMCRRCLAPHGKWPCRTKQPCGLEGCSEAHHKLLHVSQFEPATVSIHRDKRGSTLYKIVPVTLHGNGRSVSAYAFLDDGSNVTLVEDEIAEKLGLEGDDHDLCLQWTSSVTRNESSRIVQLSVSKENNGHQYPLSNVRTISKLDLPQQTLNYEELCKSFPHLRGLPVKSYQAAKPQILIGLDNARLKLSLNKRESNGANLVAAKTRLGWAIYGGQRVADSNFQTMVHVCKCTQDELMHQQVADYFLSESSGICPPSPPECEEDQRARKILEATTKRTASGRFETGLLWADDFVKFPNSFYMADRRSLCLARRLEKDPFLKANVVRQIEEYQERGYAHKATEQELRESDPNRVWYLPISVVCHPRKPNKVRVVWDAAARVGTTSLNSMLLKGPDLLKPLLSVLFRFRERQFSVAGDIRQMFHQLLIRAEDRQAQRFLWRIDEKSPPEVFVMNVATFGATCSPCSALYVKDLNASEHLAFYPEAAQAIVDGTYVDDFLDSKDTIAEAVKLAEEVAIINSAAGFEIPSWKSNSEEVLQKIGTGLSKMEEKTFSDRSSVAERILGIVWLPDQDVFTFTIQFRDDLQQLLRATTIPTKRQVLQVVMSFFDPIGIIAAFTIHGKILIQDIWRSGISWDQPISHTEFDNWKRWVSLIPNLEQVRIPRCYFPDYEIGSYDTLQLHIFADASELAYSCVAFFRIVDRGHPRCSFVAAKTKVTPLRPQSIPRNELNGALIGVRLMETIEKSHRLKVTKRFLWTDSSVVLSWLRADPRKYRQYVGFRVGEILSKTNIDEWNWVPSKLNIADEATKWNNGPKFDPSSTWFTGPDFLLRSENEWPKRKPDQQETPEEMKVVHLIHYAAPIRPLLQYCKFSRFEQLTKYLGYLYHFFHLCQTKNRIPNNPPTVQLTQKDYAAAETALWRLIQAEKFADEIAVCRNNLSLPVTKRKKLLKSSPLAKICLILDDDGVLRAATRIDGKALYYPYNFRNPVVLPKDSHVTKLLILKFHQRYGHANTGTVLNEIQQRFYIPKCRATVKSIIKNCAWCRVYKAVPCAPRMACLPHPRVRPYVRAFTFTGVDYFGPVTVRRGRANVKRWICLFTCLTVRAIHLEVVHSMSSDSCIKAIRRFVARRGPPKHFYSDNGTNFRGASRELSTEIKNANYEAARTFTNAETEWHFNPPSTPHMGGIWERKVRSVKDAFKVITPQRQLDDEELVTFLAEIEMLVNSHPLTFVPLDSPNEEVLTPNNFLLLSSDGSNPPKVSLDDHVNLRANWKSLDPILNQFWKKWISGYLPTIARRTKWFSDVRPLKEGDLVVIVDETVRNGWLRGRIVKTYPDDEGQVRKVDIRTDIGILQRGAVKVALLDLKEEGKAGL
ncbi:uncharacterized protein LOC129753709 [Uranotaenia lowii]|uniref:uncharacterized protein LOC129753709 n=1 Tax=Uranotaenia lowii TaxID=190385 RepID=UPI00247A1764|nr:uncharacterized protein LOC129753709 [Uranotaenia lowii]